VVISLSKTKLEWYVAPVFPFFSLFIVVGLRTLISLLSGRAGWTRPLLIGLAGAATAWFVVAMVREVDRSDRPRVPEDRYAVQLASFKEAFPGAGRVVLGTSSYQGTELYYRRYFATRGLQIEPQRLQSLVLRPGDTVLTSVAAVKKALRDDYETRPIFQFDGMEGAVVVRANAARTTAAAG